MQDFFFKHVKPSNQMKSFPYFVNVPEKKIQFDMIKFFCNSNKNVPNFNSLVILKILNFRIKLTGIKSIYIEWM